VIHADETGVNIDGRRQRLHAACDGMTSLFMPREKRGEAAMRDMGVIPKSGGFLVHDHWRPYYTFSNVFHSLCNEHHLRELQAVFELGQKWARIMTIFLLAVKRIVNDDLRFIMDSGPNHLKDLSLNPAYSGICGFAAPEFERPLED
jgi:transposase